jgi:pyruvate dehydrogenase E2 component (dihydrolipoamide acetyltransferase)
VSVQQVIVPDIGDFKDVPIVEIHIKEGSPVNAEDPLITLESDKATMDVPAPRGGTVDKVLVKVGDRVSEGSPVLTLKSGDEGAMTQPPSLMSQQEPAQAPAPLTPPPAVPAAATPVAEMGGGGSVHPAAADFSGVHASPAVRRIARELSVDLTKVKGTGEKERITKEDVLG